MADLPPIYTHPTSGMGYEVDDRDYTDKNNTKLSAKDEAAYQKWAKDNKREKDTYDYDMRGAWKEGVEASENGHFPDTYKKPNHPTFSDESKYHGAEGNKGGKWVEKDGKRKFVAGPTNRKNWPKEELQGYFKDREPDIDLDYPDEE